MSTLIHRVMLATVALAPLPLASNRPLFWGMIATITAVMLILWGLTTALDEKGVAVSIRKVWPSALLMAVVALWVLIQMAPMPIESLAHPLWAEAAKQLPDHQVSRSISLDPYKTGTSLMRLITYCAIFWLFLQYSRSSENAKATVMVITIAGFIYSLYGLVVYFSGNESILWLKKWAYEDALTSVFVNRNSFATYVGLTLLCSIVLMIEFMSQGMSRAVSGKSKVRYMLERFTEKGWVFVLVVFIITTALLLTHSRAGLISALLGLGTLAIALGLSSTISLKKSVFGAVIIVGLIGVVYSISGEETSERMEDVTLSYQQNRSQLNEQSINAIAINPWLGYGYGTYENVAGMFRTEKFHPYAKAAHNTYLENALELGTPVAIALCLSIALLGVICLNGVLHRKKDVIYPSVGLAATVLIAAHSLVDFSMQIPAVAITYSAIMGAACAQSWSSLE